MSSWKAETAADLEEANRRITEVVNLIRGEPSDLQLDSIWRAYLLLEKSVAFVKVELDAESPGRIVKIGAYTVPDERQALQFALRNMIKGSESFHLGNYAQTLKELREARNYLRVLLRRKNLARRRTAS